jgi:thiol:disulfide interchange protein
MKQSMAFGLCLFVMVPMIPKRGHKPPPPAPSDYKPVTVYDAARNPAKDLQDAMREAARTKRRILLEVGGDWCVWCHIMDGFFESHPALQKLRDSHYVRVKINYGKDNPNEEFLSHYPRIAQYPHFFVLDSQGKLLQSQDTGVFEHGRTYNHKKLASFLKKWAPRVK